MLTAALVNQKGGVGKTATTLGIASAVRQVGGKCLVVDLDPQANATSGLGVPVDDDTLTIGDALADGSEGVAADAVAGTSWGAAIACIPADVHLAEREQETARGHEFRLRRSLAGVDAWDLTLIDCQPSVGELVTNALVAADVAVVVTEADVDSLVGIRNVFETVEAVQRWYNPQLQVAGIIVNNLDLRTGEQRFRLEELQTAYPDQLWEPHVPHRTRITDAKGASAPIHDFGRRARDLTEVYDAYASRLLTLDKES